MLIEALKSGAADGEALRQYFSSMKDYTGVIGTFHFGENSDVVGIPFVLKTISGGKISTVKPIPIE